MHIVFKTMSYNTGTLIHFEININTIWGGLAKSLHTHSHCHEIQHISSCRVSLPRALRVIFPQTKFWRLQCSWIGLERPGTKWWWMDILDISLWNDESGTLPSFTHSRNMCCVRKANFPRKDLRSRLRWFVKHSKIIFCPIVNPLKKAAG